MTFHMYLHTDNVPGTPEFKKAARVIGAYGPVAWGKQ